MRARFGEALPLSYAPHFVRFVPTTGSSLWVEAFAEDPQDDKTYMVLTETGQWIAQLTLDGGRSLLAVDDGHAIVARTDVDGVMRLSLNAIRRR
ncbi:MAG: hypothetical protein IT361_08395 [Gemmatimonadaceae bacterium]|nr:hypothetical protein [Gemmatimonadaceae bacterium]